MNRHYQNNWLHIAGLAFTTVILCAACSDPGDDINHDIIEPLKSVIRQDLIEFDERIFPPQVLDSIGMYRAVAFGEMHTILEEREIVSTLAIQLTSIHDSITICAECPQAYSWVYEKISMGAMDTIPVWATYRKLNVILDSLSDQTGPSSNSIRLTCIDANLSSTSFLSSLDGYAKYIFENQLLIDFIASFPPSNSENYIQDLHDFKTLLEETPEQLDLTNDSETIETLDRMVRNEILSVPIRENWESDYDNSFMSREELIKGNADYYLRLNSQPLLFYFGAYHVQKGKFLGSQIEWLGDYLHHENDISRGNTISIVGIPLAGEIINSSNSSTFHFNLANDSREDDLFRIASGLQSSAFAWLPLSDPLFSEEDIRVQYIYEGAELNSPPHQQYDAYIIFKMGTFTGW